MRPSHSVYGLWSNKCVLSLVFKVFLDYVLLNLIMLIGVMISFIYVLQVKRKRNANRQFWNVKWFASYKNH